MRSFMVRRLILLCAMLALPAMAFAQEAVLTGTITDSTGAVLPGVTVQAVHEASGNNYEAVTDGRGVYRIPVRVGGYKISAELPGFGKHGAAAQGSAWTLHGVSGRQSSQSAKGMFAALRSKS